MSNDNTGDPQRCSNSIHYQLQLCLSQRAKLLIFSRSNPFPWHPEAINASLPWHVFSLSFVLMDTRGVAVVATCNKLAREQIAGTPETASACHDHW